MSYNYPEIPLEFIMNLRLLLKDCQKNPLILENSPYDPMITETLKKIISKSGGSEEENSDSDSGLTIENIDYEEETINLYKSINNINNLENIDAKERISVIKLKTQILQQLLDMMKESKRIKQIYQFEELVFSVLTEEQKDKICSALG